MEQYFNITFTCKLFPNIIFPNCACIHTKPNSFFKYNKWFTASNYLKTETNYVIFHMELQDSVTLMSCYILYVFLRMTASL